jgi:hypothetical protein
MEEDSRGTELSNVIRIDDERVRDHLGRIVRGTVEETLNAMLEAEADRLCATRGAMSAWRRGGISALAATTASCRPRRAR